MTNNRVETLDVEVTGGGLTAQQVERLERYHHRIHWGDRAVSILVLVVILAMATAQYP